MIHVGDALTVLRTMPDESVHCVVCSPPYWGLRDYGVDGQLGLERTPEEYLSRMVEVFREVRRVLRSDGTLWCNMGDSYSTGGTQMTGYNEPDWIKTGGRCEGGGRVVAGTTGLKPKDLCGIPWRLALALQADGWVLRSDIVWAKPNPMPESVTDRPTKSHEYVFMLSKAKWIGPGEPPIWLSEPDKAWLAAMIDSEGTICFQQRAEGNDATTWSVRLSVVNTHRGLLEKISAICNVGGGPGAPMPRHRSDGVNGRPVYSWQITNAKAAKVIAAIRPYLVAKGTQADLALSVHLRNQKPKGRGLVTSREDIAFKRMAAEACSALNHGEQPDLSWFKPVAWGRWTSQPYMYDAEAIKEECESGPIDVRKMLESLPRIGGKNLASDDPMLAASSKTNAGRKRAVGDPSGRNARSVWTISTQPFPEAHFATFPEALAERCIRAGTSERGCCPECGAPWGRVVEREYAATDRKPPPNKGSLDAFGQMASGMTASGFIPNREYTDHDRGFRPSCSHASDPTPCTVLDPFGGAGTVGLVAAKLNRDYVLIELKPEYAEMAERRIKGALPLFAEGVAL